MSNWLYLIIGALVLIAIIYIVFKFPESKLYVFTFLGVCLAGLTFYCGYQLDAYYHARGGIFGAINGIFDTNVVEVENMTISLSNIEMTQDYEDVYSAKVLSSEVMSLSPNEEYSVLVNGSPCSSVVSSSDYVIAEYEYSFLDENLEELCRDTLFIRFSFYSNSTYLSVSTSGGANAVKYWNYYFNKNEFVIDVFSSEYTSEATLNYTRGQINYTNLATVSYYLGEEKVLSQVYLKGQKLDLPNTFIDEDFYCWSLTAGDNWEKINDYNAGFGYIVQNDFNLYAILLEDNTVTYISNGNNVHEETVKTGMASTYVLDDTYEYLFLGWSLDGETVINQSNYIIEHDVEFIAVWQLRQVNLKIYNLDEYGTVENVQVDYHDSYELTQPSIQGLTFTGWKLVSGQGTIVGNTFTAGNSVISPVITAVYDKAIVNVIAKTNCSVDYSGTTIAMSGNGVRNQVECYQTNHTDSLTITGSNLIITIESDVEVSKVKNGNVYTISWADASYCYITVKGITAAAV